MRRMGNVALVSAALLLTGCGSGSPSATLSEAQIRLLAAEAEEAGYTEQASILEDGIVTVGEYETAVDNYVDCVTAHGYVVSERTLSPVDNLSLEYATSAAGFDQEVASANIQTCSSRHIPYVKRGYLGSHEHRMDDPLASALAACVSGHGVRTSGDESTPRDFFELEGVNPAMLTECISEAAEDLYPDLPSLSVSF